MERERVVSTMQEAVEGGDLQYALRMACDIANDDRDAGNHAGARRMIDRACQLVKDNPGLSISWLYFGRDADCHAVYRAWRDCQPSERPGGSSGR